MNEWDFIVVGAGSAGCAAAYELARSGRNRVMLLEAGGSNQSLDVKVLARVRKACERFDWGYWSEPDISRGGRRESWLRGRVLGGSSSINGTIFVRGAPNDFDRWASMGNIGWSYRDVLPLFRDLETYDRAHVSRGKQGHLHVRTVRNVHPLTKAFLAAAVTAGFIVNQDYNDCAQEGVSYIQLSQRRGLRCSAADAFIAPIRSRPNFNLELNALVERILFENGRAVGVCYRRGGVANVVSARHVVICAGAINTPKLLMLSGVGDQEELRRLGIEPVVHLPEVGKNLQEHPLLRMVFKSRISSHNPPRGIMQYLQIAARFGILGEGPISTLFEAIAFLKTSQALPYPDVQLHFAPIGYLDLNTDGSTILQCPSFTVLVNQNYPKSRGRVRIVGRQSDQAPIIECNLLGDVGDRETLVRGIRLVRSLIAASPMAELVEAELIPGPENGSVETLERYVHDNTEIAYHPVGTCRMGPDRNAVVSPQLSVNGTKNLWIGDASIMPDLISGNTNGVCMMIGMKLGRFLKFSSI